MSKATGKKSDAKPATQYKVRKKHGEPVALTTPDFLAEQKEQLRHLLPHVFTEGKVDLEKLRTALGDDADERPERYSFTWAGKRAAIQELQEPTWGTLVPAKDESVNFDTTQNIFIEGENLEVLKLLYKSYFGRVKLIYIDPPYNTGNDFVYSDSFADPKDAYLRITGQKDAEGNLRTSNPESSGRYHSAWLSMMYPRLFLARQLLRDDGVIFVSIDDHEVFNLRLLMNELYGEENFLASFVWKRRASSALAEKRISVDHEYVLAYQRGGLSSVAGVGKTYDSYSNPDNDPNGDWTLGDLTVGMTKDQRPNQFYVLVDPKTKRKFPANPNRVWSFIPETMAVEIAEGRVVFPDSADGRPMVKRYRKNLKSDVNPISTWIRGRTEANDDDGVISLQSGLNSEGTKAIQDLFGTTVFNYSKPPSLISSLIEQTTSADDIVLDFFAGSGTTAQAVLELNRKTGIKRKYILAQLPESTGRKDYATIADITKERLRRVGKALEKESEGDLLLASGGQFDSGFSVFKLAPSNFKVWQQNEENTPSAVATAMELFNDPLVEGWKPERVIWEVAVKEGFSLVSRIEKVSAVKSNKVFAVNDAESGQSFRICLDDDLKAATVRELGLKKDDLFICRDVAIDDKLAANLALQCRLKTI